MSLEDRKIEPGKHGLSKEEMELIAASKKRYMDAVANGSTDMQDLARQYHDLVLDLFIRDHNEEGTVPGPLPGCGPDPDPDDEHVKEGGWGGDESSAKTWESIAMKDDPSQWKVVDKEGKNIAHKFSSEEEADRYISYHQCIQEQGTPGEPSEPAEPPKPPVEPTPGGDSDAPYPAKGEKYDHKIRRAVRHYASGDPDDETIEANCKNIKDENHQFVVDVKVPSAMEHDDNLSMKHGGTHMGTGWFDQSVSIYGGKTGLGTEKKHPSTKLFVIKGPAIGDQRGKTIKIAAVYFKSENKCELWTKSDGEWTKQVEGTDIGGFNPKASVFECQLRIDGFKKDEEPKINSAFVTAI